MDHPISTTYLDVQVAKASVVLPAAGAYDTPLEMACPGFQTATLFVEYTRGGAGGAITLKPELSPVASGDAWHQASHFSEPAIAGGSDTVALTQREAVKYAATGATIEKFTVTLALNGAVERLRVACAESGAVGTPGTAKITAVFS